MSVNAPSPLRGLFTVDETRVLLEALMGLFYQSSTRPDPREILILEVEDFCYHSLSESYREEIWPGLMGKVQELDAWEADFLLTAVCSIARTGPFSVREKCLRAGLPLIGRDQGQQPSDADTAVEVQFRCGHSEIRGIRDQANGTDQGCAAPVACYECRGAEARRTAKKRGWKPLRGTAKERALAAEVRVKVLECLEGDKQTVSHPSRKTFFAVVISHLKSLEDPRWWLFRRPASVKEILLEILPEAFAGASPAQLQSLLSHRDAHIRAVALRQVGNDEPTEVRTA